MSKKPLYLVFPLDFALYDRALDDCALHYSLDDRRLHDRWLDDCGLHDCGPHDRWLDLCGNNQCVGCTRQFFTKSFLGDDAAVLARPSGEEPASPRHRAGVASIAWRALGLDRRVRRLLVHAEEEGDVRELREGLRAERPGAASFLVILQLASVVFHPLLKLVPRPLSPSRESRTVVRRLDPQPRSENQTRPAVANSNPNFIPRFHLQASNDTLASQHGQVLIN